MSGRTQLKYADKLADIRFMPLCSFILNTHAIQQITLQCMRLPLKSFNITIAVNDAATKATSYDLMS